MEVGEGRAGGKRAALLLPVLHCRGASCSPCSRCLPPRLLQVRAPLEKKLAEEPEFMAALAGDIQALAAELAALGLADS